MHMNFHPNFDLSTERNGLDPAFRVVFFFTFRVDTGGPVGNLHTSLLTGLSCAIRVSNDTESSVKLESLHVVAKSGNFDESSEVRVRSEEVLRSWSGDNGGFVGCWSCDSKLLFLVVSGVWIVEIESPSLSEIIEIILVFSMSESTADLERLEHLEGVSVLPLDRRSLFRLIDP